MVIRGKRWRLILQGVVILAVGVAIGLVLQSAPVIRSSALGQLDEAVPLPVVALVIVGLSLAIAVTLVRDSWNHRIELGADHMVIASGDGSLTIPYRQIASVKKVPAYGLGIVLNDFESWIVTQSQAPAQQRRISAVLKEKLGVHVAVLDKNIDIGTSALVELVGRRAKPGASAPR